MTNRDAVREALVNLLGDASISLYDALAKALGVKPTRGYEFCDKGDIADALLGRAQQGEAEPEAWVAIDPADGGHLAYGTTELDAQRRANVNGAFVVKPLYTRPVAVTAEMVNAAIQGNAEWWATPGEVSPDARYRHILTAALNAAGPNPKEGE